MTQTDYVIPFVDISRDEQKAKNLSELDNLVCHEIIEIN